ncbi:lysophospholipid acyltransferase family protein [Streptomyces sp. NPDC048664]|uniref:lysophospholipid acyltransferase family protein n=1 Tax=Streptomyces sp. NPDC048664 TaxID=3154505 RepID=UPI00344357CD
MTAMPRTDHRTGSRTTLRTAVLPRRGAPVRAARGTATVAIPAPVAVPGPRGPDTAPAADDRAGAWLPSAPCTPRSCVEATGSARAIPRALLRLVSVLVLLVGGIALLPAVRRLATARRERLIRTWCRTVVSAAGVRVRITGEAPRDGGLLMVANHVSWLDVPLLAAVRPGRMLAKTEIRRWPVAGALTAASGALFIDRDRLRALPATVARIADGLRGGSAVVVFPEGSTWCGRAQGHFRRAAFQAALDAGVPVLPVRLLYRQDGPDGTRASTVPAFVGSDSLLTSVWRVVSSHRLVAEVRLTPLLGPDPATDRRALAHDAQRALRLPPGEHTGGRTP